MKNLKLLMAALAVAVLITGLALYIDYRAFLNTPMNVPGQGMELSVPAGASISGIASQLREQGVLRSSLYLQAYARRVGVARRIQAGDYAISPGTTPIGLVEQLVAGRVIHYALTVVEGWTFRQMLNAIAGHEKIKHTLLGLDDAEIMARLGRPDEHPEGRFFPDTYYFPAATTDLALLKRAYQVMERRLQEVWERRVPGLPLNSPYEVLILASLIEKETGLASERREVAGVLVRRLQRNMLLQTDPTVIYGLGDDFDGVIRRRDLRNDTPYNTYTRRGLPPTPIALPGGASLAAAVDPAPGTALYFVSRGDGSHAFSDTLEQHNRAVRQYILNR